MTFGIPSNTRQCSRCFEEWIVDPEYITFHVCKGKPKDFIVGEIVEDAKSIER